MAQVNVDKLSQEMSSNQTLNYITQLELDKENLRRQLLELSTQLKNSKVINCYFNNSPMH